MPSSVVILFLAVLAGLGLMMLIGGLRVRRRGDTPHCRKCDYPLTGLAAPEQCPECGAPLASSMAVARGDRYRRSRLAWAGLAVLLIAGTPLSLLVSTSARGYDWYRVRPTAWVLNDLESSRSLRAANELGRRYQDNALSVSHRNRLFEFALAEQGRNSGAGRLPSELVELLSVGESRGELSHAQLKRFYEQMVILTLTAPSPVTIGRNVSYTVKEVCRCPGGTWWVRISSGGAELSDQGTLGNRGLKGSGYSQLSGLGASGSAGSSVPARVLGTHQLSVLLKIEVYKGSMSQSPPGQPVHIRDITLTTDVKVVPPPNEN
jgi:hypothetical protein